jgi:drug/metabolite transporter (DMT)-like permease
MTTDPPRPPRVKLLLAFAAIYFLWGSTYLAVRWAIDGIPPFLTAGCRLVLAGAVLAALAARSGAPRPTRRQWRAAVAAAVPLFVLGHGGVCWAQQHVPTGASALLFATLPVWLLLLDWGYGGRGRPRAAEVAGTGLGLAGVALLTAPGGVDPGGAAVLLGAAAAWAVGSLVVRHADVPASPLRMASAQMLVGGALLLGLGAAAGDVGRLHPAGVPARSLGALGYLILTAVVAVPAYNWLLAVTSPAAVGTYAFVNPVVAVALGWALAGEAVGPREGAAAGLVVCGVMLLVRPRRE